MHARNQGAPAEAYSFFDRALAHLPPQLSASASEHDINLYWQALVGRDEVLGILGDTEKRMADDHALVAFAEKVGNDHFLAEACFHQGYYLGMRGQYTQELEVYTRGLEAARRVSDRGYEAEILGLKILCELRLGDLDSASKTSKEAIACAQQVDDDLILARCLSNVSTYYTETGDMARGVKLLEQQLAIIHRLGNLEDEVVGLSNLGYAYIQLGMPEAGISNLQRCIKIARSINHRKICAYGGINLALAYVRSGNPSSAMEELQHSLVEFQAMNDAFGYAVGTTYIALAREQVGQIPDALADFTQAAAKLGEIGTPGYAHDAEAGIMRCLLSLHKLDEVEQHVASLWDYLTHHSATGMEFPVLAYESCADAFSAIGQTSLARRAVGAGYGELLIRAGRISLPEWRKSFLEQVPEHYRIQKRWQEYSK
jgi:tetratricopeptide (TPR) repeat protein